MIHLDDTDKKILHLLQSDAKLTIREIATQLNLSTTPIFDRIKKLEKNKVITRHVALLDKNKIGKKLTCFLLIENKDHSIAMIKEFTRRITSFDEVMECYHISGDANYMIKVAVNDMEEYNEFLLTKMSKVPNIYRYKTQFALSCTKHSTAYKIH